jgi:hypothetical protein
LGYRVAVIGGEGSLFAALLCALLCVGLPVLIGLVVLAVNVLSRSNDQR